jgi:ABC-type Zn uptake system ZnuABC Zn-binding protein ZnuA
MRIEPAPVNRDVIATSKNTMTKKLSDIAKKMAASILRRKNASPEAVSIALQMVHIAWNYAGEDYREEPGYIHGIQEIEKSILSVKEEFVMDDLEKLIERLMKHKSDHYPNDQRVIFSCGYQDGNVKVLWR